MISVAKALKLVSQNVNSLAAERTDLAACVGRVLAEPVVADSDLPPFDRSQMDGFAVRSTDTSNAPVELKIVGESAAGDGWHNKLKRGEAVRIMTGAPVPKGADSVIRVELTSESNDVVTIHEDVEKGMSIVKRGAEIKSGKVVFKVGERITEKMIASLASFGYAKIEVARSPRVAILATGSEIVDIAKKPKRDQIRNSNSVMLDVLCRKFGSTTTVMPIAKDDILDLKLQISAAAKASDIVIITGGVSVGKYDLTKAALNELGAEIHFEKVALKPGKPTVFGRLGKTLVFGLPGNPVSSAVEFHLLVRVAILKLQSAPTSKSLTGNAILEIRAKAAHDRDTYIPASVSSDDSGRLVATTLKSQGSSDFIGFARADALVCIPMGERREAGEIVKILYI